ncbi:MAG TPA: hypothetical protein VLA60_04740 [Nitrospirales bacterium]|nr:hypothetical protein [Nitrospirales bacterium]
MEKPNEIIQQSICTVRQSSEEEALHEVSLHHFHRHPVVSAGGNSRRFPIGRTD